MRFVLSWFLPVGLGLEIAGVPSASAVQGYKVSGPLAWNLVEDVDSQRISPDGTRVVYRADQEVDGVPGLYGVALAGGQASKLNSPLSTGWVGLLDIDFAISPDSSLAVYSYVDLFSVPIGGGQPVQLNPPYASGGRVDSFSISPDSSRVVFQANGNGPILSVPIQGGPITQLNVTGGRIYGFALSPDSSRVVYRADQDVDGAVELYSVPIGGGPATKLSGTLVPGGQVYRAEISPDSNRVVYVADELVPSKIELFSVPIAGGARTRLNGPLAQDDDVHSALKIGPDSGRAVYRVGAYYPCTARPPSSSSASP